jgi:2-oxoglutarate dehydrogenase E1 component
MVEAPVFHVNADDPEAVCFVTELALDYRMEFQKDVVIDLVCFRRHGHNEQDEPMVTQPLMYKLVSQHPGTRKLYADKLAAQRVIQPGEADAMIQAYRSALDQGYHTNRNILTNFHPPYAVNWERFRGAKWNDHVQTGLPLAELKALGEKLTTLPAHFKLHPRVEKVIADRRQMTQGKLPLDWGMAENLAYAAIIKHGYGVRLSGQDTGRGTFFHRHAVLHDQARERWDAGNYIPLQNIAENQPPFVVIDSVLSEEAVLGFEYGYATAEPNDLVMWEAQFGDFANGAQVVIDQFIASGEVKWGRLCGLVLMLPHGYEGQGPEHSSARLERFLQLCADYNMQIVVPSAPAQMFHVLRRQMLRAYRKPLIIMSPKSMLRHKESVSSLEELSEGKFHPVIGETDDIDPAQVRRVVFCSGKVYYDLRAARRERAIKDVAIVRLEQLYPFPHDDYTAQIEKYAKAAEVVWCQEEPGNQGAWHRIQHYLLRHLLKHQKLTYALRPSSASPAAGYSALHNEQQKAVMDAALTPSA